MKGTTDVRFILTLMVFFGYLSFLMTFTDIPQELRFVEPFDFVWWVGGIIGVTGACVVWSGVPCAGAIAVWGIGTVYKYVVVNLDWLKLLVFTPLIVTMIYVVMKLARG